MKKAYRVEEVKLHPFLSLSTRWRQGVNFTPQPLDHSIHRLRGWMGPRADLGLLGKTKIWPQPKFEAQIVHNIAR